MYVCLCLPVCLRLFSQYRLRGGLRAIPTASAVQVLEKQNGDFTAIEKEKLAWSRATLRGPAHQLAVLIRGPPRGAHRQIESQLYRHGLRRPGLARSARSGGMCVESRVALTARYPLMQLACVRAPTMAHGPAHIHQRYNACVWAEGLHFSAFHIIIRQRNWHCQRMRCVAEHINY